MVNLIINSNPYITYPICIHMHMKPIIMHMYSYVRMYVIVLLWHQRYQCLYTVQLLATIFKYSYI